jgi:hypothetical protein
MSCAGHCFDFAPAELPTLSDGLNGEGRETSIGETTKPYVYTRLRPWQTRVLRLHPPNLASDGREFPLSADLLIVTVPDAADFLIDSTGARIEYTALSYSWGYPMLAETLICNGYTIPISRSNAAALLAIRSATESTHVWIDAICVNQKDAQEKSTQVAGMLKIYEKARSVTVWLGEPDADSLLAFACIQRLSKLKEGLSGFDKTTHMPCCHDQLRSILLALSSLYDRPWLRRTWIRQEIYGAKHLTIHCGSQRVSWDDYIRTAIAMKTIRAMFKDEMIISEPQVKRRTRLLSEALRNGSLPPSGVKDPKNLVQALLQTRFFEATDPKDTFYAVLGMCNVAAFSKETSIRPRDSKGAVLVDYTKSLVEVYHDATLCILHRKRSTIDLQDLWHSYRTGLLHADGLPLWAVDWQSGISGDGQREDLGRSPLQGHGSLLEDWEYSMAEESADLSRGWYWPEPLDSDAKVLRLRARVLNYVAYLTDFTCEPYELLETDFERLGSTGWAIHSKTMLRDIFVGHAILYPDPGWERFNFQHHSRRLAILGVGDDSQLCLVPSQTQKGDLIVATAPGVLSMVISPKRGDRTAGGLIPHADPYEDVTKEPSRVCQPWKTVLCLCENSTLALLPFTVALGVSFGEIEEGSLADTILMITYGVILLLFLFGYIMGHHFRDLNDVIGWRREFFRLGADCVLVLQAVVEFFALYLPRAITGQRRKMIYTCVVGVLCAVALAKLWRKYRQIDCRVKIASRRLDVFKTLDIATEKIGRDYEFRGPVIIGEYARRQFAGEVRTSLLWYFDIRCVISNLLSFRLRNWPRHKVWNLELLALVDRDSWPRAKNLAWKRPIQEFRVH